MSPDSVCLYKWSPVLVRNNLYFMGLKEQNPADLWRTSRVVDRRGSKRVVTMSGKVYELVGKPVVLGEELRGNVPVWVQEKFKVGMPINWVEVVEQWGWVKGLERAFQSVFNNANACQKNKTLNPIKVGGSDQR